MQGIYRELSSKSALPAASMVLKSLQSLSFLTQFPTHWNREYFSGNRELIRPNRELEPDIRVGSKWRRRSRPTPATSRSWQWPPETSSRCSRCCRTGAPSAHEVALAVITPTMIPPMELGPPPADGDRRVRAEAVLSQLAELKPYGGGVRDRRAQRPSRSPDPPGRWRTRSWDSPISPASPPPSRVSSQLVSRPKDDHGRET